MKIYIRSSKISDSRNIDVTSHYKHILTSGLKNSVLKNVKNSFPTVTQIYPNWISFNDLDIEIVDAQEPYERLQVNVIVTTTIEISIAMYIDGYANTYMPYISKIPEYLESNGIDGSRQVLCNVFFDTILLDGKISDIEKYIEEVLVSGSYRFHAGDTIDARTKKSTWKYIKQFTIYCDKNFINKASNSTWPKMIKQLENEYYQGINSISEMTRAGSYIDNIAQKVEKKLGLYSDTSTIDGHGDIIFYDSDTDDIVFQFDYSEFCSDLIHLSLESKTKYEFVQKLTEYYKR